MGEVTTETVGIGLIELLPFLMLVKDWKDKDVSFLVQSMNALNGKDSWTLLTLAEQGELCDWLDKNGVMDPQWLPLREALGRTTTTTK